MTHHRLAAIVFVVLSTTGTLVAGSLTPPGPPAPTMKAIDVAEPRNPISSLPFTISVAGSYYLTKSVTLTGNVTAITVNAGPTTIDLRGFSLIGDGSASGIGISVGPYDVVVRNGLIHGWGAGIQARSGGVHVLEDLTVRNCTFTGAWVTDGIVQSCGFHFNGGTGLLANGTTMVKDSRFLANGLHGVSFNGERSLIEGSVIDGNGTSGSGWAGATMQRGGTIRHCIVNNNSGPGIQVLTQSFVVDNNVYGNLGSGIVIADGDGNRIEGNNITGNANYAVYSNWGGNIILRNTMHANAWGAFSLAGSNVAPLETNAITNAASNVSY